MKLTIYTDGGSRGNPGQAAIAFLIYGSKKKLAEFKKRIGIHTNNEAEYLAIIEALDKAIRLSAKEVVIYSDSLLVVNQIRGEWKIKKAHLRKLFSRLKQKEKLLKVEYKHVKRSNPFISKADRLVNMALD